MVFESIMYDTIQIATVIFPIMKYTNAVCTDEAPIDKLIICTTAANIPPSAWPPTTAVMYLGRNFPMIENKLPDKIALDTKIRLN